MPGKDTIHTAKWDRCVKKLEDMGKSKSSAAAICSSSIDDAGVKKGHQKKDKKDYYANRKKADKKNEGILRFEDFSVNEDLGFNDSVASDVLRKIYDLSDVSNMFDDDMIDDGYDTMQNKLEEINDLIKKWFPELKHSSDDEKDETPPVKQGWSRPTIEI